MMNVFRALIDLSKAQQMRFATNRRNTLMLAIAGIAGTASPSAQARADVRRAESARRMSAATSNETGGMRGMKAELTPKFQNLKTLGSTCQVMSIQHCGDAYSVATADGRSTRYCEANLRFKINSSDTGPLVGKPIILSAGSAGDRASVFFASPTEISALVKHRAAS